MAQLSSCYFCGGALETPVESYELPERDADGGTSVMLCPVCREKLDVVLESAGVDGVSPAGDGSTTGASEREATAEGAGGELDEPFDDEGLLPADDPLGGEAVGDPVDADGRVSGDDTFETPADGTDDHAPGGDGRGTDGPPETGTQSSTGPADTGSGADGEREDEPPAEESADDAVSTGEEPAEVSESETPARGQSGATDTEAAGGSSSRKTVSALEYNRVMRMLQNREFPVDRNEIVVVASNAYDLAESECAQVIDLAVDRGLLEERDGELYRPEE